MPSFVQDIWAAYGAARDALLLDCARLQVPTRILLVLALIGALIYSGSRVESAGWSALIFLGSFGLFAYVFVLGYSIMH